ncbi:hypothetical protein [Chitinophaga defluvii]|uniref:DUF4843 domain-containing protein n=1 Tax=Chitinophaga defluvii TaxID=3163343 RepID=A0ABV2T9G9_9BACT
MPMKFRWLMPAFFAGIAGLTSCEKKETVPQDAFSFKVDGMAYNANQIFTEIIDTAGKKALIVDGVSNNFVNHQELIVFFPDVIKPGTNTRASLTLMNIKQEGVGYITSTLTVNITSINSKYAEGTFTGTLTSGETEKPLTDGTFKVYIH